MIGKQIKKVKVSIQIGSLASRKLDQNNKPSPDSNASFVEHLRWMREPDHQYKDGTKVQILQLEILKVINH